MSVGQIAALVAAVAFVLLVVLLAVPLLKLGRTLDEATVAIRKAHEGTGPLLDEAGTTITTVNTQLRRVDGLTASAQAVAANTRALSAIFTATLGGPVVKAAALSYGLRKAMQARKLKADTAAAKAAGKRSKGGARAS